MTIQELAEIEAANSKILARARTKSDKVVDDFTFMSVNEKIASRARTDKSDIISSIEVALEDRLVSARAKAGKPNTQQQLAGVDSIVQSLNTRISARTKSDQPATAKIASIATKTGETDQVTIGEDYSMSFDF